MLEIYLVLRQLLSTYIIVVFYVHVAAILTNTLQRLAHELSLGKAQPPLAGLGLILIVYSSE